MVFGLSKEEREERKNQKSLDKAADKIAEEERRKARREGKIKGARKRGYGEGYEQGKKGGHGGIFGALEAGIKNHIEVGPRKGKRGEDDFSLFGSGGSQIKAEDFALGPAVGRKGRKKRDAYDDLGL